MRVGGLQERLRSEAAADKSKIAELRAAHDEARQAVRAHRSAGLACGPACNGRR